ncbi:DNA repair protein RadC [Filimonas lacunae]|uniref:DNA repair protein RadC n=1 Tax=Filimonas lacunae TaxID=477680 RepID=A0A173MM64_9BACT|nr:DNA repair protein RadC [Filimonas lacunae]BAV08735.1 DNA repair protein RadC [Filimonas lacunae]SIS60847.1 DNA repair protein RadC [Filimonas lacunae]
MYNTAIKEWAVDDRPREKLLHKGANFLSNSELIAVLINNGTRNKSAVAVAKDLLAALDNELINLSRLTVKEILNLKIKGIGPAKAVSITAALELGLRRDASISKRKKLNNSKEVANYIRAHLQFQKQELFAVIYLNQANRVAHFEVVSEGGINSTIVDARVVLRKALEHNAVNLILCHNHPSGNTKPSEADLSITNKLKEAALTLDINIVDHVIMGEEGYFSFADHSLL